MLCTEITYIVTDAKFETRSEIAMFISIKDYRDYLNCSM